MTHQVTFNNDVPLISVDIDEKQALRELVKDLELQKALRVISHILGRCFPRIKQAMEIWQTKLELKATLCGLRLASTA